MDRRKLETQLLGIKVDIRKNLVLSVDVRLQDELLRFWKMNKLKKNQELLFKACCHGSIPEAAHCLDMLGCDINAIFENNMSALMAATANGFKDLVEFLIQRGCDIQQQTPEGRTALHFAVKNNQADMVRLLLETGSNPHMCERQGEALPMIAASHPNGQEVLQLLLDAGADPNSCDFYQVALLHQAAKVGLRTSVELLIKAQADLDVVESWGHTPLMIAVLESRQDIADVLISAGASTNIQDKFGRTALHFAARRNLTLTVGKLLDHGADPDVEDSHHNTALIEATYHNLQEVAALLIQGNCDLNAEGQCLHVSWQPMTPLSIALHCQNYAVAKMLCKAGCNIKTDILENYGRVCPSDEAFSLFLDDFLQETFRNPRPLYDLCRFKIRSQLGYQTLLKTTKLPLPRTIQDDIALADILNYTELP